MAEAARFKVFVTRQLPPDALARLRAVATVDLWPEQLPPSAEELARRAADVDGLLTTLTERVDDDLLAGCPRLKVVSNLAVGFDNLDVDTLTRRGIPAGNTPGVLTEATADLAFALLLATARRIVEAEKLLRDGRWVTWDVGTPLGKELAGATLGIVGFGRIGQAVARRALAFSMEVIAYSRSPRPMPGVEAVAFDELLQRSDFVSLHVSLNDSTHHLIGAAQFETMKPSAILINTARGAVVDQAALDRALRDGSIAGAGIDVFEREPIGLDDPLLGAPNCVLLPHIGSATTVTRARMADLAVDNLIAGLRGEPLRSCVNPIVEEQGRGQE